MKSYDIYYGDKAVGIAQVIKEGLYFKITCRCTLSKNTIHRIYVQADGKEIVLGVCVPQGEHFVLEKKLAVKHLGQGELTFSVGKRSQKHTHTVRIMENQPFGELHNLHRACLVFRDDKAYAVITHDTDSEEK